MDPWLLIAAAPWVAIAMFLAARYPVVSIGVLFVIVWTGGSLVGYGLVPDSVPEVASMAIVSSLFTAVVIRREAVGKGLRFPAGGLFALFGVITLASALFNGTEWLRVGLFARYFLVPVAFFLVVTNEQISQRDFSRLNKLVAAIVLLQVPVATWKFLFVPDPTAQRFGEFGSETFTGTYATHGGASSVLIPLIAIGFLAPAFLRDRRWTYAVASVLFVWFSIVGSKRAIVFVLPVFLAILLLVSARRLDIDFGSVAVGTALVTAAVYAMVVFNYTLTPQQQTGGSFDPSFVFEYARNYTMLSIEIDGVVYSAGRVLSTVTLISYLLASSTGHLILGYGPGLAVKSGIVEDNYREVFLGAGIEDGITGWIWTTLQVGFLGSAVFVAFVVALGVLVYRALRDTEDEHRRVLTIGALGLIIVFLFDFLIYSEAVLRSEYLNLLVFYGVGQVLRPAEPDAAELTAQ